MLNSQIRRCHSIRFNLLLVSDYSLFLYYCRTDLIFSLADLLAEHIKGKILVGHSLWHDLSGTSIHNLGAFRLLI